jgi:hypothetical protein
MNGAPLRRGNPQLANSQPPTESLPMKITNRIRKCAHEHPVSQEKDLLHGMAEKSKRFVADGAGGDSPKIQTRR